jgi:hypothetical protein
MKNNKELLLQLQQMLKSGCPDNQKLAFEIAKSLGLYKNMLKPWENLWKLIHGNNMRDYRMLSKLLDTHYLNLSARNLKEIPEAVFYMPKLKYLDISKNKISHIPAALAEMPHLYHINLNNNLLESLPTSICNMSNLIELYLSGNRLQALERLSPSIEILNISDNNFTTTPVALLTNNNLHSIDITHNEVACWNLSQINLDKLFYLHVEVHNINSEIKRELLQIYDETGQYVRLIDKKFFGAKFYGLITGMNFDKDFDSKFFRSSKQSRIPYSHIDLKNEWQKFHGLEKAEIIQEYFLNNREIRKFFS